MSVVIHGINSPLPLSMDVETHLLWYKLFDYTRHDDIRSFLMGKPQSSHEQSPASDVLLLLSSVNSLLVSRVGNEAVTLNVSFMKRTITPVFFSLDNTFSIRIQPSYLLHVQKKDCVVLCEASLFLWLIISVFFFLLR